MINVLSTTTANELIFGHHHLTQFIDVAQGTDPVTYDRDKLGFTFQELFLASNLRNKFPSFNCGVGNCNFTNFPSDWLSDAASYSWTGNTARHLEIKRDINQLPLRTTVGFGEYEHQRAKPQYGGFPSDTRCRGSGYHYARSPQHPVWSEDTILSDARQT